MPQRQVSRDTPAVASHSSGPGAIPTGIRACVEFEVGSLPVKGFSGCSGFPFFSKAIISKCSFDLYRRRTRIKTSYDWCVFISGNAVIILTRAKADGLSGHIIHHVTVFIKISTKKRSNDYLTRCVQIVSASLVAKRPVQRSSCHINPSDGPAARFSTGSSEQVTLSQAKRLFLNQIT